MEEITLIANENKKSPVSEAYRTIRTNLAFSQVSGKELKVILMTSATPNEGKSTTISNLAVVMATNGQKVCLVDCDFRNPTQHKIFGIKNVGMSNAIIGKALDEVIQPTKIENLYVIASGPVAPNPSELLASQKMTELLAELKQRFDYVLVDAPPIMPVTDAVILGGKVDGVILLVGSGDITPQIAKEAKKRLVLGKAHILGAVLNKVDIATGHGNSYGYYYYYGEDGQKKKKEK